MQKIVLFIDPNAFAHETPLKIGNLFMNRFAVDEDAASEILKIYELEGMDLIITIDILICFRIILHN